MPAPRGTAPLRSALTLLACGGAASAGYQFRLLLAAVLRPPGAVAPMQATWRWVLLVPAHDEAPLIAGTLAALGGLEGTAGGHEIVVVADHCTDATASLARAAGATVLEREGGARGKGAVLAWALDRVLEGPRAPDAVVVLDADCRPTTNLLVALEGTMRAGAPAAQADYVVANPGDGVAAALRHAAFGLMNTVRPLGKEALGASAGLRGSGMAFSRELLERHPFRTTSLVEDHEFHFDLVAAGERVAFCPQAAVCSDMPPNLRATSGQQLRWESARLVMVRRYGPRLVRGALRGDRKQRHAVADLVLPPQTLLTASLALAAAAGGRGARRVAAVGLLAQTAFVVGGLRVTRAPRVVWCSLLAAPALIAQRLWLTLCMATGRGARTWERAR